MKHDWAQGSSVVHMIDKAGTHTECGRLHPGLRALDKKTSGNKACGNCLRTATLPMPPILIGRKF